MDRRQKVKPKGLLPLKGPISWQSSGRLLVVVMCLFMAASLTAYRNALEPPGSRSAAALRRSPRDEARPYRLTAFALQMIKDKYVDPTRVDPRQMLRHALEEVEGRVAEVMVEEQPADGAMVVKVDIYRKEFEAFRVDSVATLYTALKDMLGFIGTHLSERGKLKEIEYAAINGMLSTLDPHSLLLDPEVYRNLKMGTRGSFGGLGIVISIRDGMLTIVSPIDDTPAFKAGLEAGDRIVKIGNESAVTMTLNEAVNKLRGDPGTKVILWIEREGWAEPRRFVVTRAVIRIKSVASRMLKGSIGYLRIKHFSRTTYKEVGEHLTKLKRKGAKSLIVDLYNNPGGLLDQAIRVADLFMDGGDIVTTVGYAGKKRETMEATSATTLWRRPVAVLVNSGSASASEILAGALKGRGRAVVVGTRTFGKGSVQVLFDNEDGSALKLTIAQYLTPGDTSIQSVGIVPDVRVVAVRVEKDLVNLFAARDGQREQDLEQHLDRHWGLGGQARPLAQVRYLARARERHRRSTGGISGNAADREVVKMAAELLAKNPRLQRDGLLQRIKPCVAEIRDRQQRRIVRALAKLDVDWKAEPASEVPMLEAVLTTASDSDVRAGEEVELRVEVTNMGLGPAYRVRGVTSAESEPFDKKEFLFGRIDPGESRVWKVAVPVPLQIHSQMVPVRITFAEEYGHQPPPLEAAIRVRGLKRPLFAMQYQLIDDLVGNQDGLPQKGEHVRLRVTVRNIGEGKSLETVLALKNLSGPAVNIRKGRLDVGTLRPGGEKVADFTFDIRKMLASRTIAFELSARDTKLKVELEDRIVFPLAIEGHVVSQQRGWVVVRKPKTELKGGPSRAAPRMGWVARGGGFRVTGKVSGWYRVDWRPGRPGFIPIQAAEKVVDGDQPPPPAKVSRSFQVTPPVIRLEPVAWLTSSSQIRLKGVAVDDDELRDLYIEVIHKKGSWHRRKVFYQSNRFSMNPKALSFSVGVPVKEGLNYIRVIARQNDQVLTELVKVVLKRSDRVQRLGLARPAPHRPALEGEPGQPYLRAAQSP
jgi:carboxyl-terminal processing protease